MKLKLFSIIFFLSINFCFAADQIVDENKIYKNLRCLVCQGQSVADSNSDFAQTLKMVVKDLIDQEKTEEEIIIPKKFLSFLRVVSMTYVAIFKNYFCHLVCIFNQFFIFNCKKIYI